MSLQQTLQGGSPTATQQAQRTSDTSGIDTLSAAVQLGTKFIGSAYAEAQAAKGYQNAFQQYNIAKSSLDDLEKKLGKVTAQYHAQGKPDQLLFQMSVLEDTVRKARLGEASGKLSGLSMKARVESAYKQALNRFPAFASELRAHRDAVTSSGAIGAAVEQSEISLENAKQEAKALIKSMNDYGLSYFNASDRLIFQSTQRRLGEITRRNEFMKGSIEPLLTRLEIESKFLSNAHKQFRFNSDIEDRPGKVAKQATELEASQVRLQHLKEDRPGQIRKKKLDYTKSKYAYERDLIEDARKDADRPLEVAQKDAVYRKTSYDALNEKERYTSRQTAKKVSKLVDDNMSELYAVSSQFLHEGAGQNLSPDEKKLYIEQIAREKEIEAHQMFSKQGATGSTEYTRTMKSISDWKSSMVESATLGDPTRVQKRMRDAKKVELDLDLMNDPNWKRHEMLKSSGMSSIFTRYASMMADAEEDPTTTGKSLKQQKAQKFLELTGLDSILPSQLQVDLRKSVQAGKPVGNTVAVEGAAALGMIQGQDNTNEELNESDTRVLNKLAMDSQFGLDAMSSYGGLKFARASSENKASYQRSYDKKLKEVANMLPDGYGVKWSDGQFHIIKATEEGGEGSIVATLDHTRKVIFDPFGADTAEFHGFDKWPFEGDERINTDGPAIADLLKDFAWIHENGADVIQSSPMMKNPDVEQNKGFLGTTIDLAKSANAFIANNVVNPIEVAVGIDVETSFATEGYETPKFNAELHQHWQKRGKEYAEIYNQASVASGVPIDILVRQGSQESGFDTEARSEAGALGISQFMPATARAMGLTVTKETDDRLDPTKSIYAQAQLMKELLDRYNNNMTLALVDYNGGPKAVKAWKSGKPYKESKGYIKRILGDAKL